jgi:hypothetical protein
LHEDGFHVFGYDAMPMLTAKAQSGERDPKLATYKDDLDLALIQPSPKICDKLLVHYRPFSLEHVSSPSTPSWIIVSGWPARKNVYNQRRRRCDFKTCFHIQCPVLGSEAVLECGRNSDIHFAVSANKKKDFATLDGSRVTLPDLDGISGAGAWQFSEGERSLAGIVVEDHPSKHMLLVIKIAHVWTLLRHWFEQAPTSFVSVSINDE